MLSAPHVLDESAGETHDLGIVSMRLLAHSEITGSAFALAEFSGDEGPWTIPHIHRTGEESFYVLEGTIMFTVGDREIAGRPGSFIIVPRGVPHVLSAGVGGARMLTLWTPGGREQMFLELSRLPGDSLRDPETRRELAKRFDSIPV